MKWASETTTATAGSSAAAAAVAVAPAAAVVDGLVMSGAWKKVAKVPF